MRRLALALILASSLPATTARADWEITRSAFDPRIVARYKQLLRKNPDDAGSLRKLLSLYKAHRSAAALEREYESSREPEGRLVWAHLARERGDHAEAARRYGAALDAGDARARLPLAAELVELKREAEARPLYEAALAQAQTPNERKPILRRLAELAQRPERGLAQREALAEAARYYEELLRLSPGDDELRRELAELYARYNEPRRAADEWRTLAARLGGDPAQKTRALERIGELSEAANDDAGALAAYEQAAKLSPKGSYLEREAIDKIIGVHRRKDRLRELCARWEKEWGRSFAEVETLARLHDELGDTQPAQEYFRKALALDGHAIEARRRLIALLERAGKDAEVIAEYRKLVASAPGEPRFRLELAERLWKSPEGNRDGSKEAIAIAERLGKETRDPSVHSTLAELFSRWGLPDQALAEREQLVRLEPNEEAHLVNLGELWFQRGKKDRALEVWKRLLNLPGKREQAMARLAEVYAEHDLAGEALELYQKAVKLAPDEVPLRKGLAQALERMHREADADLAWQEAYELALAKKQRALAAEMRPRLLGLDARTGRLPVKLPTYRARFAAAPPGDDEALAGWGLLVVDGYLRQGRIEDALDTLRRLGERARAPEVKADALVATAQVLRARHDLKRAIAALEKAAQLVPSRARELYAQIAELSLALYRDGDALSYAKKAIELGPADAQAQLRLAEVYERRDQIDEAVAAYQRALELNDRLWKAHFVLARLHLRRGEHAQAARLYRDVIRRAPDEELVIDAARRAVDLEEYLGTLGELERELEPLSYAHPDKPVYRERLLDLYQRYAGPLVPRAHAGDASARRELERLGEHALRPLLEALVDESGSDVSVQRQAVTLLGELGNPSAAEPLLKLAQSRGQGRARPEPELPSRPGARASWPAVRPPAVRSEIELRVDAALAGARLATARDLPLLLKLAQDPEKYLRASALYGLGRLGGREAEAALERALADGAGDVQAIACLSLARASATRSVGELARLARDPQRAERAREAAAAALGLLAPRLGEAQKEPARAALIAVLDEGADALQLRAAWALGALGPRAPGAAPALLEAIFGKRDELRRVAIAALAGESERVSHASPVEPSRGPEGIDLAGWLAALPLPGADAVPAAAWRGLQREAGAALAAALGRHRDVALRALVDLDGRDDGLTLGPLELPPPSAGDRALLDELAAQLAPEITRLAAHSDPTLRAQAVRVAAKLPDGLARVEQAIADPALEVRLAALESLARRRAADPPAPAMLVSIDRALHARDWRERRAAVLALGASAGALSPQVAAALAAALDDANGFVREQAAHAVGLACRGRSDAAAALLERRAADESAAVRAEVASSLGLTRSPRARGTLDRLVRDADPEVRDAARAALARL